MSCQREIQFVQHVSSPRNNNWNALGLVKDIHGHTTISWCSHPRFPWMLLSRSIQNHWSVFYKKWFTCTWDHPYHLVCPHPSILIALAMCYSELAQLLTTQYLCSCATLSGTQMNRQTTVEQTNAQLAHTHNCMHTENLCVQKCNMQMHIIACQLVHTFRCLRYMVHRNS